MWQFRKRPPYSQEEIAEQIGQIADLIKMKDKLLQGDQLQRGNDAISVSQEVLAFMLDEVRRGQTNG